MSRQSVVSVLAAAISMTMMGSANAAVSPEEVERLGRDLTCMGAERAANADGSIPEFKGLYIGEVPGWTPEPNTGAHPVDPYSDDKPLVVITSQNYQEHMEYLSEGQVEMLKRYPDTYKMNIYPGRREFAYPQFVCDNVKWNAENAELVDDGLGFKGIGYVPFPIPKNGDELMWNHSFPFRSATQDEIRDIASVTPNGTIGWGRARGICMSGANRQDPVVYAEQAPGISSYCQTLVMLPLRERGNMSMNHDPYNWAKSQRTSWSYNSGTRRVRLAPGYGFDQPMGGSNGSMTIDEDRLFNGSPERYDWKMIGKQEMYVPANAYKVNGKDVTYDSLLTLNHPNPDYLRYEKRRVWVLEATIKPSSRHLYAKRVMYLDEDSWHGVMSDYYDTRGNLWKHGIANYYYHPDTSAFQVGAAFYHDLSSGHYMGYGLTNERDKGPILNKDNLSPDMFTPDRLRAQGL